MAIFIIFGMQYPDNPGF